TRTDFQGVPLIALYFEHCTLSGQGHWQKQEARIVKVLQDIGEHGDYFNRKQAVLDPKKHLQAIEKALAILETLDADLRQTLNLSDQSPEKTTLRSQSQI